MAEAADDGFPQAVQEHFKLSDQLSYAAAASTMELDLQHHLAFNTPWNSTWANSNHDTIPFSFIGDLPPSDSNPLFHFNVLPQPPLFGELFQSVPHGYSLSTSSGGGTEYQEGDGERLESTKETGERTKHYATAREKRTNLNDRYKFLGSLVPKPSKVLDELHLDLQHVASGQIGDYYSFLFNAKIYEGASVHAGAIANKLIEVMDTEYAAIPTSSY
ncbi:hypothetical protein Pint_03997 [Pistacia integerrima]|uniref:Uncharacterized protein n=1 Tax=Pistacia integerrima TaxID=434235 RepID=A0ACC0Z568_9ROSI|nr:hypothetical protein Pint_03997 [Pistacia integerrima]